MSDFICPRCAAPTLSITDVMELGSDDDNDDRTIQTIACSACAFEGIAWYEASRRGSDEVYHHTAHDTPATADIKRAIASCSTPRSWQRTCSAHSTMRARADDLHWLGPRLPMRLR